MKTNRKVEMTDRRCDKLEGPDASSSAKEIEYSDVRVPRLKLMVSRSGRRTWYWRYVWRNAKEVIRIGEFPGINVEQARRIAMEYGAQVDQGIDPKGEKKARMTMPTLEEFALNQYLPYAFVHKRSADDDAAKLRMYILPKMGKKLLCDITRHDVDMHRTAILKTHSKSTANRHHALIARMLALAVEWDILKLNPVVGLRKFRETADRGRYLAPEEIAKLLKALDSDDNVVGAAALKVLLFTGCRREEIAQARWENLDVERGLLKLPKTKSGKVRWVPLSPQAQEVIASLPDIQSEWIFPGRDPSRPINNLYKPFHRALRLAGIETAQDGKTGGGVRIHDLRHSFASNAVTAGLSLYTVQALLGHSTPTMTQRYAAFAGNTLHDAVALAAKTMLGAVEPAEA